MSQQFGSGFLVEKPGFRVRLFYFLINLPLGFIALAARACRLDFEFTAGPSGEYTSMRETITRMGVNLNILEWVLLNVDLDLSKYDPSNPGAYPTVGPERMAMVAQLSEKVRQRRINNGLPIPQPTHEEPT